MVGERAKDILTGTVCGDCAGFFEEDNGVLAARIRQPGTPRVMPVVKRADVRA